MLFVDQPDDDDGAQQRRGDERPTRPERDRRRQEREHAPRIHRMTHAFIGAGGDNGLILLDAHGRGGVAVDLQRAKDDEQADEHGDIRAPDHPRRH
jgi:hypothetical protein